MVGTGLGADTAADRAYLEVPDPDGGDGFAPLDGERGVPGTIKTQRVERRFDPVEEGRSGRPGGESVNNAAEGVTIAAVASPPWRL
jgi:hypothetical protein